MVVGVVVVVVVVVVVGVVVVVVVVVVFNETVQVREAPVKLSYPLTATCKVAPPDGIGAKSEALQDSLLPPL